MTNENKIDEMVTILHELHKYVPTADYTQPIAFLY